MRPLWVFAGFLVTFALCSFAFGGGPVFLRGDSNTDGTVDMADAVYILQRLFGGGPVIPPPGLHACGPDPTPHPMGSPDLPSCIYPEEICF